MLPAREPIKHRQELSWQFSLRDFSSFNYEYALVTTSLCVKLMKALQPKALNIIMRVDPGAGG